MKKLSTLLCYLGLHPMYTKVYKDMATDVLGNKHDLNYSVCKLCGYSDPETTGEW